MSNSGNFDFKRINGKKGVMLHEHNFPFASYAARDRHYRTTKEILRDAREHRESYLLDRLRQHSQTFIDILGGAMIALIIITIIYSIFVL